MCVYVAPHLAETGVLCLAFSLAVKWHKVGSGASSQGHLYDPVITVHSTVSGTKLPRFSGCLDHLHGCYKKRSKYESQCGFCAPITSWSVQSKPDWVRCCRQPTLLHTCHATAEDYTTVPVPETGDDLSLLLSGTKCVSTFNTNFDTRFMYFATI